MQPNRSQIDRDTAIAMAVFSGNLLYREADDAHAWALTLIVSNLKEDHYELYFSPTRFWSYAQDWYESRDDP